MSNFRRFPFRCRACSRRFYQYVARAAEEGGDEQADASAESPHDTGSPR